MDIIDISGIPDKGRDAIQRGIQVANGMCKLLGLNLMQACAIVGYCMKESSCNPASTNQQEVAGKGTGYANGANCGEGIAQWTNVAYKDKNLAAIGIGPGGHPGKITALSLDQQIQMLAKGSLGQAYLRYKLNTATSWDAAVACACIQGHGSGHAKNCFDAANGDINTETYVRAVMSKYGSGSQDLRRAKKWGMQVYSAMGGVPGAYNSISGVGTNHEWPDFNLKDYPINSDEKGRYTSEPILMSIANHLQISCGGGMEGNLENGGGTNGTFQYSGSWGELTALGQQVIANANTHTMMMGSMNGQTITTQSHRCCTSGPGGWYTKAGITLNWGWTRQNGVAVDCNLAHFGFVKLWDGKMGNGNPPNYMPGDVVAIYTTQGRHQHGVMWTGKEWLSDYIQRVAMCGSHYASIETHSQLWRHPKCWTKPPV